MEANKNIITTQFLDWVLVAKGIGIILVVVGHYSPNECPLYWVSIQKIIYLFHMPLFFLLSGYLYHHGRLPYKALVENKTRRLFIPFMSVAFIFLLIKLVAGMFFNLQNPVTVSKLFALISNPLNSYIPLLWFVHALLLIFLIYPVLKKLVKHDELLLLFVISINIVTGSDYEYFGKVIEFFPYFLSGLLLREKFRVLIIESSQFRGLIIIMLGFASFVFFEFDRQHYLIDYFVAIFGALGVISISINITNYRNSKIFKYFKVVGYYSMSIYLFHTLFESFARIIFVNMDYIDGVKFIIASFCSVLVGIIFPLILEKYIFRRFEITNKYLLGIYK